MEEKKQSHDWLIAATLWLTAGLAIPFIAGFALASFLDFVMLEKSPVLFTFLVSLISIVSVFFGTIYCARYINKTYVIKNSGAVVMLATAYMIILQGGAKIYDMIRDFHLIRVVDLAFFTLGIAAFYVVSKQVVRNSDEVIIIKNKAN